MVTRKSMLTGVGLAALLAAGPAWAQAPAEAGEAAPAAESTSGITDIVVTAQRREESAQKVSIAMTVLGEDALRQNVSTIADVAKLVPNIQLENPLGFGIPRTGVRGIAQSDFNANATTSNMVYLDDVPMNAPLAQGVPIWDLARAEVLRGPQGTLFGRNATGGAIRYITAGPGASAEGYADVTFGLWGHREIRLAYGGPLTDTLGVRISAVGVSRAGDARNINLNKKLGEKDNYGVRAVVLWEPSDNVRVALRGQYFHSNQDIYAWKSTPGLATLPGFAPNRNGYTSIAQIQQAYGFTNEGPETNFKIAESDVDPNEFMEHIPVALTVDIDLGNVTLTSASGYVRVNQSFLLDLDSSPAPIITEYDRHNLDQWTQEIRLTSNNDGPFNWIAGAFYIDEKIGANLNFQASEWMRNVSYGYPTASTVLYTRGYEQQTKSFAFFGHTTYEITPELKLTAAARWTKEIKDISWRFRSYWNFPSAAPGTNSEAVDFVKAVNAGNLGTLLGAAQAPLSAHKTWSQPSWKLGLDYQVTPRTLLYGFVARGFKGGSFVPSANTQSQVLLPDGSIRSVRPETVTDYEVGVKSDIIPGQLRVNAGAFYYDYRQYQTNQFVMATQVLSNLPKARAYGAEIEINWSPVDNLNINLGGGILRTKILKALDPALVGNELPLAQRENFNGSISYRIETPVGDFTPEASVKYRGHFYQTKENIRLLGGQTTFDARLGFESPEKKFYGSLWVRNLTNKVFPVIISDSGEFYGADIAYLNERRTAGITAGVRF